MAETNTASKGAAGASQGASAADLDPGQGTAGAPQAPAASPATREGMDEQHGGEATPEKKEGAGEAPAATEGSSNEEPASEEPVQGSDEWHKQFIQTGNEHADAAIDLMKEAGVSPIEANAVFQKAIESGKLEDINWSMLEGKLGKAKTGLVKAGVEQFFHGQYKQQLETVNKAYEVVGGQKNWETIRAWAQKVEKTDAGFKAKVDNLRDAIALGGWSAEQAVRELHSMYEAAPNNKGLGVGKVIQGDRAAPAGNGSPLSRSEYMAERHKLAQNGVPDSDPRVRALFARRQAGRTAGI